VCRLGGNAGIRRGTRNNGVTNTTEENTLKAVPMANDSRGTMTWSQSNEERDVRHFKSLVQPRMVRELDVEQRQSVS